MDDQRWIGHVSGGLAFTKVQERPDVPCYSHHPALSSRFLLLQMLLLHPWPSSSLHQLSAWGHAPVVTVSQPRPSGVVRGT